MRLAWVLVLTASLAAGQDPETDEGGGWIRWDDSGETMDVPEAAYVPSQSLDTQEPAQGSRFIVPTEMARAVEARILELTNIERQRHGVASLLPEETLAGIAREHSLDMQRRRFFDHRNPDGLAAEERIANQHRRLIGPVGENLWMGRGLEGGASELARLAINSWLQSPGHRRNLLRPGFTHLGVGVVWKGGALFATQNFAEAWAYLDEPFPETLRAADLARGRFPALRLHSVGGKPGASHFAFAFDQRRAAMAGVRLDAPPPPTVLAPGRYLLRIAFPKASSRKGTSEYTLTSGPSVRVE